MPQPDDRKFSGNFRPIPMECDAYSLPVRGKLPRELNGSLYRNGPNPQFESPGSHWFVGDGMLHAFTIENGTIATAGCARPNGWPSMTRDVRYTQALAR
jgi:carotenoid cleavage dioxygenase